MPDLTAGKIIWGIIILSFAIIPLILITVYFNLSAKCSAASNGIEQPQTKTSGGKKFFISLIIIIILSGLTAQAINHSYHRQIFKV